MNFSKRGFDHNFHQNFTFQKQHLSSLPDLYSFLIRKQSSLDRGLRYVVLLICFQGHELYCKGYKGENTKRPEGSNRVKRVSDGRNEN